MGGGGRGGSYLPRVMKMCVYRRAHILAQQSHVLDPAEVKRKYHILSFEIKKSFNTFMVILSSLKARLRHQLSMC